MFKSIFAAMASSPQAIYDAHAHTSITVKHYIGPPGFTIKCCSHPHAPYFDQILAFSQTIRATRIADLLASYASVVMFQLAVFMAYVYVLYYYM